MGKGRPPTISPTTPSGPMVSRVARMRPKTRKRVVEETLGNVPIR